MQETRVGSLGKEDALEKEMPTHSSILDWKISWTEEPGKVQFMEPQNSQIQLRLNDSKNHVFLTHTDI